MGLRRNKKLGRTGAKHPEQRRYLIYCEGECTEAQYFKGVRAALRSLPVQICLGAGHGEPVSLVREAIAHKERAPHSPQDRYTAYDQVWRVVDVEAPRSHPRMAEALALARRSGNRVGLTSPCFELWLLIHFTDVASYLTSKQAQSRLEQYAECGYTGRRKHVEYAVLEARYEAARSRARRLRRMSEGCDPLKSNPWTDVDVLLDDLMGSSPRWPRGPLA